MTLPSGEVVVFNSDADWIQVAYLTLSPLLGVAAGSPLFALITGLDIYGLPGAIHDAVAVFTPH